MRYKSIWSDESIPNKQEVWSVIEKLSKKYNLQTLCYIFKVSPSGYYAHKKLIETSSTQQDREQEDVQTLQELCKTRKKGYRSVTMQLRRSGKIMNHKKVLRLMKKYDLLANVRKKNPYKYILKANQEHKTRKNLLNRRFREKWDTPLQKLGTDITYIRFQWKWCYLSIIRDMITGEVPSHVLSRNLSMWATLESIEHLEKQYTKQQLHSILLHSDQWFHYTHPSYQTRLKELWITQSMSRKGNCLDNAPTESFFGHMKDEIDITSCKTFQELVKYIENYIFEYNNNRPQWNKKKMTPVEYRNHLLTNKN